MKAEILSTILDRSIEINNDTVLFEIYLRARKKYLSLSAEKVTLFEIRDYILSQLKWKKQDLYYNALPLIYKVCQATSDDFESLFDEPENYREAYFQLL